jgi:hypothetical protein
VGVVVDAELDRHGQEDGVSLGNGFVFRKLVNENIRFGGVAAAKNGSRIIAEEPDRVGASFPK